VPDSLDGRERIIRLEERVDGNRRQLETLAPLATQFAVLQTSLEDLSGDLERARDESAQQMRDLHADFVHALTRDRADMEARIARAIERGDKRFDELSRSLQNQVLDCSNRVATIQEAMQADRKELVTARRNLNVALIGAIAVVAAALISSVIPNVL
jgi:chromosome segregation ATPase